MFFFPFFGNVLSSSDNHTLLKRKSFSHLGFYTNFLLQFCTVSAYFYVLWFSVLTFFFPILSWSAYICWVVFDVLLLS